MNLDWSPLQNIPNAGEAFLKGMERGKATRLQAERQNALTGIAQGDPAAMNALMAVDPQMGMQYQAKQRAQMKAQTDQRDDRTKLFARAALSAKTPEQWEQRVDQLVQMGYPEAEQARGQFAMRDTYISMGGESGDKPTELQRNHEYLNSQDPALGKAYIKTRANPPMFIPGQNGGPGQFIDRGSLGGDGAQGADAPTVTDAASYEAIPAGASYRTPTGETRVKPGGQASAPGNFPEPVIGG